MGRWEESPQFVGDVPCSTSKMFTRLGRSPYACARVRAFVRACVHARMLDGDGLIRIQLRVKTMCVYGSYVSTDWFSFWHVRMICHRKIHGDSATVAYILHTKTRPFYLYIEYIYIKPYIYNTYIMSRCHTYNTYIYIAAIYIIHIHHTYHAYISARHRPRQWHMYLNHNTYTLRTYISYVC